MSAVLTRAERVTLAAVSKHLRLDGWLVDHGTARNRGAHGPVTANWQYNARSNTDPGGRLLQVRILNAQGFTKAVTLEADVYSVTEAVDVLVAVGLLPQGLSSAYAAGRESAPQWTEPIEMYAEDVRPGWLLVGPTSDGAEWREPVISTSECTGDGCPWFGNCVFLTGELVVGRMLPGHYRATRRISVRIPVGAS